MISLTFDIATGVVKATAPAVIKVGTGVQVPLQVVFSEAPGASSGHAFRLGKDTQPPVFLAAATSWSQVNSTTWTATLDAGASALVTYMSDKGSVQVNGQFSATIDGALQVSPNMAVTLQAIIPAT